jgi:hypothetical protein
MQAPKRFHWFCLLTLLLLSWNSISVEAQSIDINAPAPISTSSVVGRIVPRDLGDARFTDYYYAFAANPGDLLITVESSNLNGDIDIFTSTGLRPLLKFTVYAESSAPITKSIFLRKREDLIVRVEARTPNDDDGTYQLRFGGTFDPLPAPALAGTETPVKDTSATVASSGNKKGRRVSSAGARLPEPEPTPAEVAAVPTPEPTPAATPESTSTVAEKSSEVEAPKAPPARTSRPRRPTTRRGSSRTQPPAETAKKTETEATTTTEEPSAKPAQSTETASASTPPPRTRRGRNPKPEPKPAEPEPDVGPRLVIETRDGTLVDRSMSTVRRVMIENGQVVVVAKDGGVQRIRLADVVKMSIAP